MKKTLILSILALFIAVAPSMAHAGFDPLRIIDPFCVVADCGKTTHTTVIVNPTPNPTPVPTPTPNPNHDSGHRDHGRDNTYAYNYPQPYYPPVVYPQTPSYNPLGVSCYSVPTSGNIGDNFSWRASPFGGTGNYYITWTGSDGLSGYGTSIFKTYNYSGSKYASVSVTSGSQTITQNCSNNAMVYDYNYNNYNYDYNYNYNYNSPLSVSCSANVTYAPAGTNVIWQANASGGNGYYTYNWSGTDNLYGTGRIMSTIYNLMGIKTAMVIVTSGSQTVTQTCYNSVNVNSGTQYQYPYQYYPVNNSSGIQIACYPDKTSTQPGTPVTWSAEVVGATGNLTYSWSGTEGLSGNMLSLVKTYNSTGRKTATISVVSSIGQTATQICGSVVNVSNPNYNTGTVRPVNNQNNNQNGSLNNNQNQPDNSNLSAASLFSLKNVPWGWVAVLVILILFGTVMYLIYNRNKI